jgi:hypothetical protein
MENYSGADEQTDRKLKTKVSAVTSIAHKEILQL